MSQHVQPVFEEEYADESGVEVAPAGMLDSLSQQFGAAPWWVVSGSFHALLLLLITLIGMAVFRAQPGEAIYTVEIKKDEPPKYEEKKLTHVFEQPVPVEVNLPPVEQQVVYHEFVEPSEFVETEDDAQEHAARGDEKAISDVDFKGISISASIGVGGPSGGMHGTRGLGMRRRMLHEGGGTPGTESAVLKALDWLARHQEADGHWDTMKCEARYKTDTAVTGFALLAFLGYGHTERVGKYKDTVKRATRWLISKQQANGLVFDSTDAGGHRGVGYPHAIAGMALAEAAGMGAPDDVKKAAQKAVDYSIDAHQQGDGSDKLGWRYQAKQAADLSVTGWYVMQLKSAVMGKLSVDPAAFEGALKFLDSVEKKVEGSEYGASVYHYQPGNPHEHTAHRLTAIGTLCRQFMGFKMEELQGSVDWFVEKGGVPEWGATGDRVDLYYWYYGTLCAHQQAGAVWKRWNDAMIKALCENQRKGGDEDGSWDPLGAYSGEWGRAGQTALGALCLEVYYRYHRHHR